jgi:hypothetical protein
MRFSVLGGLLAGFLAGCCCDDDDYYYDCPHHEECYWDVCCGWYCYDVHVCNAVAAAADPAELDFSIVVVPQGDDVLSIGVEITGRYADGESLLSVMLRGEEGSGFRRQSRKTVWWFYGVPAASAREIEVRVVGEDLSAVKALPAWDAESCARSRRRRPEFSACPRIRAWVRRRSCARRSRDNCPA